MTDVFGHVHQIVKIAPSVSYADERKNIPSVFFDAGASLVEEHVEIKGIWTRFSKQNMVMASLSQESVPTQRSRDNV